MKRKKLTKTFGMISKKHLFSRYILTYFSALEGRPNTKVYSVCDRTKHIYFLATDIQKQTLQIINFSFI